MRYLDQHIREAACGQRFLITRDEIFDMGGNKHIIESRIRRGLWQRVHAGVYQVDRRPLDWESELLAAVLACGPNALVSHRAAFVLWGLDGIRSAPVEVTVPYDSRPIPDGVIVHRTRRQHQASEIRGIPVATVERTLLSCSARLPKITIGKGLDSAIRTGVTTVDQCYDALVNEGGRGVRGTKRFRWALLERCHDIATDSGSEYELLYHMQMSLLPRAVLHHVVFVYGERRVLDFYWPALRKAIEVDGIDAHSSADRLDDDLVRQNALMDLGIELRRFSARRIRREPQKVVAEIRKFLES
jgi:very-short-patch-repair endonuclease